MKKVAFLILLLLSMAVNAQETTAEEWNEMAKTNIRLLPEYGNAEKSEAQKKADREFIDETLKQPEFKGNNEKASAYFINKGFEYYYKGDLKTAMYRFNQAYLLNADNTDIYWGYGAVYMALGDYEKARELYEEGLKINPQNTHLLTDYGTYYLGNYYQNMEDDNALQHIDSALLYLNKSVAINPTDASTLFKLSVCYLIQGDCKNSWKFYNKCLDQGGAPITPEYTDDLILYCPE